MPHPAVTQSTPCPEPPNRAARLTGKASGEPHEGVARNKAEYRGKAMIKSFITGVAVAAVVMVADWATAAPLSLSHTMYSRADQMAPVEPQTEQGYETPAQFR